MRNGLLDRMSIGAKLWLLVGSLLGITTLLWFADHQTERHIAHQSAELAQTLHLTAQAADQARETQNRFKTQVQEWKNMLIRGHDAAAMAKYRQQFDTSEREVDEGIGKLKEQLVILGIPTEAADKTLQEHRLLGGRYREALGTWNNANPLTYREVDAQLKGIDRPMNEAIGALAEATMKAGRQIEARETAEVASAVRIGTLLSISLLAIGTGLGLLIARAILKRVRNSVREMSEGMERMVAGDFSQGVEVHSQDEMGRMAEDFNTLVRRFQELFAQLRNASSQVAQDSQELSSTAGEVSRAAGEIAQFAENQRTGSERTAAAMTQFAASIQEVSHNVRSSNARTETMVKAAEEGARQGEATVMAMQAIQEANQQMVKAVQVIQDLARQTNLLALNAAIEAAKAGEHGVGFAVVADEVRKLAEHSSNAAKQISNLIEQTEVAMREGVRTVEATDGTIRTIQENIQVVAQASRIIGTATEEQRHTSDEVSRQVEHSALSTERSAAASTELAHTVEEVNRTAEHLARISEELSTSLGQFRTA